VAEFYETLAESTQDYAARTVTKNFPLLRCTGQVDHILPEPAHANMCSCSSSTCLIQHYRHSSHYTLAASVVYQLPPATHTVTSAFNVWPSILLC